MLPLHARFLGRPMRSSGRIRTEPEFPIGRTRMSRSAEGPGQELQRVIIRCVAAAVFYMCCSQGFAAAQKSTRQRFQLESGAFAAGGFIPQKYTCSGDNVSPALSWKNPPNGTQSLVLIVADPDAPSGTWIHWIIYNLPPSSYRLPEGVPKVGEIQGGARQGTTSFQEVGYGGPCPPPGSTHHYHFNLYALNVHLRLPAGATGNEVDRALKGHILGETELVGLYKR
jgi:Raf kinase inhibitor-like YbhB/YbcL family protein